MRLFSRQDWPGIPEDVMNVWKNDETILYEPLPHNNNQTWQNGRTFLKAFNGAPIWTAEEVRMIRCVFECYGLWMKYRGPRGVRVVNNQDPVIPSEFMNE
jgi:hypothetical protein